MPCILDISIYGTIKSVPTQTVVQRSLLINLMYAFKYRISNIKKLSIILWVGDNTITMDLRIFQLLLPAQFDGGELYISNSPISGLSNISRLVTDTIDHNLSQ